MVNPHNPDFITKKPWYLSGGAQQDSVDQGPSIEHQKTIEKRLDTSLEASERALEIQRKKEKELLASGKLVKGQWVEALFRNKLPYRMCQIVAVHGRHKYDLKYEDGTIEHQIKQTDRPRIRATKSGNRAATASATSNEIAAPESWDSKRDKYHGYDRETHNAKLSERYEERERIRSQLREQQQQTKGSKDGSDVDNNDDDGGDSEHENNEEEEEEEEEEEDEFVQKDEHAKVVTTRLARQGGVGGAQMKVTARNLRIREDTAKYLRNLNLDSAYYDPKSRSMRDNPNPDIPLQSAEFVGDNFARISGDAVGLAETQLFAWEAAKKGVSDLHMQAAPSLAEKAKKEYKTKSSELQMLRKKAVLDKYGGEEHLDGSSGLASAVSTDSKKHVVVDKMLRFGVSTAVQDHSQSNATRGGAAASSERRLYVPIESQYEEDIFINGHTTVWGSYFHRGAFQWGYADDHSLMKNSYCTGENGRIANDEANEMRFGTGKAGSAALAQARGMLKGALMTGTSNLRGAVYSSQSKLYGEADPSVKIDPEKLKAALNRTVGAPSQEPSAGKSIKRKYNSIEANVNLTNEDMEAYRLTKERRNDPMANVGSDEILEYK
jgi:pre-mRNA-processing factor SLU7